MQNLTNEHNQCNILHLSVVNWEILYGFVPHMLYTCQVPIPMSGMSAPVASLQCGIAKNGDVDIIVWEYLEKKPIIIKKAFECKR